jgi:hypothetical protein
MGKIIEAFWNICRFKIGPQDLPASSFLMLVSMLGYAIISVLVGLMDLKPVFAVLSGILDVALVAAMTQLLLWIKDMGGRFMQTFTALMGTGAILGVVAVPLLLIQMQIGDQVTFLPKVFIIALTIWNLAIVGHILRHAISAPFYVGVLLAVVYMYVSVSVMRSLFISS